MMGEGCFMVSEGGLPRAAVSTEFSSSGKRMR